jgi:hypothetical protein
LARTLSSSFTSTLAGLTMSVVELYRISTPGMSTFTYTDSNTQVYVPPTTPSLSYAGLTYDPYPIKRNKISFSTDLKIDQTEITLAKNWGIDNAIVKDVLNGASVQIIRVNTDLPDVDNLLLFDGEVADTGLNELNATLRCQTLDFLNLELPKREFQVACNWKLYDEFCTIDSDDFKVSIPNTDILEVTPSLDSYISQSSSGQTFGYNANLSVSGLTTDIFRTLLKFDFSQIRTNATIVGATLSLYYYDFVDSGAVGKKFNAARITNTSWDENVTWDTQPAFTATGITSATIPGATNAWVSWNVKDQVITAKDDVGKISHFMITDSDEGSSPGGSDFYSRDYIGNTALRPKLSIKYENGFDLLRSTTRDVITADDIAGPIGSPLALEYFRGGFIKATSGKNNLLRRQITGHTSSILGTTHDTVHVIPPFPFDFELVDGIELLPGCDHSITDCETKYNNLINYGGFPWVPNQDSVL